VCVNIVKFFLLQIGIKFEQNFLKSNKLKKLKFLKIYGKLAKTLECISRENLGVILSSNLYFYT